MPEKFVINFLLLLLSAFDSFRIVSFSLPLVLRCTAFFGVVPGTIYFWLINPLKYIGSRTNRYGYFAVAQIQMLNTVNKREWKKQKKKELTHTHSMGIKTFSGTT